MKKLVIAYASILLVTTSYLLPYLDHAIEEAWWLHTTYFWLFMWNYSSIHLLDYVFTKK